MSITATVKNPSSVIGVVKNPFNGPTNNPVTLRNSLGTLNYIHSLLDVVETNPQEGDTLIYNSTTNKYEVKPISISSAGLDGGTF